MHCVQPFPKQALVSTCLQYKSFENTVGKAEIAPDEFVVLERFKFFNTCDSLEQILVKKPQFEINLYCHIFPTPDTSTCSIQKSLSVK